MSHLLDRFTCAMFSICGLVGKPEGKRSLGKPTYRRKENIRLDLKGAYWEGVGWIDLAQCRGNLRDLVKAVMDVSVP